MPPESENFASARSLSPELTLSLSGGFSDDEPLFSPSRTGDGLLKLILIYQGNLQEIKKDLSFQAISLSGPYAVAAVRPSDVPALSSHPQVLYLEPSRPLYLSEITGVSASCLPVSAASGSGGLTGKGVAIAVLDSGVDFRHPDFRNADGTTRILAYWDQSLAYDGKNRYGVGHIFSEEALNRILSGEADGLPEPAADTSGHGTHVAGICAGNGRASGGKNQGVAPEASLIAVRVKNEASYVFTDYANLMMAADFAVRFASEISLPLCLNLSYGSNDGSHDGGGLLERFLSQSIFLGKNTLVIAAGNEGISGRHAAVFPETGKENSLDFSVAAGERALYLALWKPFPDRFALSLSPPSGSGRLSFSETPGVYSLSLAGNAVTAVVSEPTPYQPLQQIFFSLQPAQPDGALSAGVWRLSLTPSGSPVGEVRAWLPVREATSAETAFLTPTLTRTLTVPSTAASAITVGGYDSALDALAPFSGRGFLSGTFSRPDLVAPAVNILSCAPGGGYSVKSGTSMAAPFVSGAAALLMQYGITEGNDPFLYGDKVRAMLRAGAAPLPAYASYPNPETGWGKLCVSESLARAMG